MKLFPRLIFGSMQQGRSLQQVCIVGVVLHEEHQAMVAGVGSGGHARRRNARSTPRARGLHGTFITFVHETVNNAGPQVAS